MAARRYVDVFEAYDRFTQGSKVDEKDWDYNIIPNAAALMKSRYELDFGDNIVPEDPTSPTGCSWQASTCSLRPAFTTSISDV